MNRSWNEYEYSKYKLILHPEKTSEFLKILKGEAEYDALFPISVELHLTNRCNLICEWCTDRNLHTKVKEMNTETIFRLISDLTMHGTGITLEGGGEPTIHPDFRRIVHFGEDCGAAMGLITNGTVDISDMVSGFNWIRISLDASTEDEYIQEKGVDKFDAVLKNIESISRSRDPAHTQVGVGFVLTKRNHSRLPELLVRLDKIGVDYIYLRPVEECSVLEPDCEELFHLKKALMSITENLRIKCMMRINERMISANAGLPCIAHSLTSIIHANGDVIMCEKRRHDIRVFGNLEHQSFEEIWTSEERRKVSRRVMTASMQEKCSVCRITAYNQLLWELAHVHSSAFI